MLLDAQRASGMKLGLASATAARNVKPVQDVADLADGQAAVVSGLTDDLRADVLLRDPFIGDSEAFGCGALDWTSAVTAVRLSSGMHFLSLDGRSTSDAGAHRRGEGYGDHRRDRSVDNRYVDACHQPVCHEHHGEP